MVLDRNPVNFFAETEQAAFHPGHVVPGIDFTNDPLLQGRLFSYTDTQISRLGGANFHELPINRPRCPMRNLQRDGMRRMDMVPGRVAYEPNSLDPSGPRENPQRGFRTFAAQDGEDETGQKLRLRPESFSDHYSQARQSYRSMSAPEQRHIQSAFAFELSRLRRLPSGVACWVISRWLRKAWRMRSRQESARKQRPKSSPIGRRSTLSHLLRFHLSTRPRRP